MGRDSSRRHGFVASGLHQRQQRCTNGGTGRKGPGCRTERLRHQPRQQTLSPGSLLCSTSIFIRNTGSCWAAILFRETSRKLPADAVAKHQINTSNSTGRHAAGCGYEPGPSDSGAAAAGGGSSSSRCMHAHAPIMPVRTYGAATAVAYSPFFSKLDHQRTTKL